MLYRLKFYLYETLRMAVVAVISLSENKNTSAVQITSVETWKEKKIPPYLQAKI